MGVRLIGCGKAVPALSVSNSDLELVVNTNDEWISSRTGIKSRRICVEETATDLGFFAANAAMGNSNPLNCTNESESDEILKLASSIQFSGWSDKAIDPKSIDLIIFSSITPDSIVPGNACIVRRNLGCTNAIAFDVNAACTGFIYALSIAESMIKASHLTKACNSNTINRALIVSSERLSEITDWANRNTCILFGDGAGAAVLEWDDSAEGILSSFLVNADDFENALVCKNSFNSKKPFSKDGVIFDEELFNSHTEKNPDPKILSYDYINCLEVDESDSSKSVDKLLGLTETDEYAPEQVIYMEGQKVFKFAARAMDYAVRKACELANVEIESLKLIIPHQANIRIIEFAAKRLGLPMDKFQVSIENTGNTSSSGVPMALYDAISEGSVHEGDLVAVVAFGGGLTSGAAIIKL